MSLIPEVKKRIGPYMKAKGFRIRNRTYYRISNAVAYCITFEQPTGLMYTWVHVNPLYIPGDSLTLTYGNRLNHISDVMLPLLEKGIDSAGIDHWCALFCRCMDDNILPFFQQIDTPEKLVAYVEQPGREVITGKICCPPVWAERLRMYTYFYLHDFSKTLGAIETYRNEISNSTFLIVSFLETLLGEAEDIRRLISRGDDEVSQYCNQIIARMQKLFQ